jgi:two-component system response regulator NreC
MPGGSSLEAIPAIREESPDTQIVVLTMQQDPAFARESTCCG